MTPFALKVRNGEQPFCNPVYNMKLFYTKATQNIFQTSSSDAAFLSRLYGFLRTDEDAAPGAAGAGTHGQIEQYQTHYDGEYKIHWIGIRLDQAGRLIGGVVKDAKTNVRYFFALEVTLVHDYQKTLVENPQRLNNWRGYMLDYLRRLPLPALELEVEVLAPQRLLQHEGRFRSPDAKQAELIDVPLRQGALCFGPPGAGKTLIGVQRALDYVGHGLKTALLAPTSRLAEAMSKEFEKQEINARETGSEFWSFERYLSAMAEHYPALGLIYGHGDETRQLVDFSYFKTWYRGLKGKGQTLDREMNSLWQEFNFVLMQPNWSNPVLPFINEASYIALGIGQSNVSKEERAHLYALIFKPFFNHISDVTRFYYPAYMAHALYTALLQTPLPLSQKFDALVLDEVQKFHPWEWACLLTLLREPLSAGQFFICGDAHQGVECQQLRVAQSLRDYIATDGVELPVYHLSINHRSSQAVSRFVAQVHALELSFLGSIERDTHVYTSLGEQDVAGLVTVIKYQDKLASRIAADAGAYVLIPNDSYRETAELRWPKNQIVTLGEFVGLSAETLVMYGFTAHLKQELDFIHRKFSQEALPSFDSAPAYARKSKGMGAELPNLRTCFQSLYTAASRAVTELIIVEETGEPHILFKRICSQSVSVSDGPSASAASASNVIVPSAVLEKKSTLEQWFLRAQDDFNRGLELQAKATLLREDLWGGAKVAAIRAMMGEMLDKELFAAAGAILFSERLDSIQPASSAAAAESEPTEGSQNPASLVVRSHSPLTPEWSAWLETILKNPSTSNLEKLLKRKKLKQFLFEHKMENGHCFFVEMVISNKGALFFDCLKEQAKLAKIKQVYEALENRDLILELCWEEFELPKLFKKSIKRVSSDASLLCYLFATRHGLALLIRHFDKFIAITPDKMHEPSAEGITPFIVLASVVEGVQFIIDEWVNLVTRGYISADYLQRVATAPGPFQGVTPLFLIVSTQDGWAFIVDNWAYFVTQGMISSACMHQVVTGESELKGSTLFWWFAGSPHFILDHWDFFVENGLLSPTSMHQIVAGGKDKGTSAFYALTCTPEGRELIRDKWDYLLNNGLISPASMQCVVKAEGRHQGKSPLFLMLSNPEGLQLIIERWQDFVNYELISPESMHQAVVSDPAQVGLSPFFMLCSRIPGVKLLSDHWEYFVQRGLISSLSMHHVATAKDFEGLTPFLLLMGKVEGQALLNAKWDYFVEEGLISADSMHTVVTSGKYEGTTPFLFITSTPIGRKLLIDKWDYFVTHGLISATSMNQMVIASGTYKGRSAFLLLIGSPEGRQLIRDRWDYFVAHNLISPTSMNKIITEEGEFKGKTVLDTIKFISQERNLHSEIHHQGDQAAAASIGYMLQSHGVFAANGAGANEEKCAEAILEKTPQTP